MNQEWLDLVDENNEVIGKALRSVCHGNPGLMHRAVHVLVFNTAGDLFLQKRSESKDVQPGRWDTSVGGHPNPGEAVTEAARREMKEELGIDVDPLIAAYDYIWRSDIETEWIHAFAVTYEGPFKLCPDEIAEGRFWSFDEIRANLHSGIFTPQFEKEFSRMADWHQSNH